MVYQFASNTFLVVVEMKKTFTPLEIKGLYLITATAKEELELFKFSKQLQTFNISIMLITIIIILITTYFVLKQISEPIEKLTNKFNKISKGELDITLENSEIDEIQLLTDALNRNIKTIKLAVIMSDPNSYYVKEMKKKTKKKNKK